MSGSSERPVGQVGTCSGSLLLAALYGQWSWEHVCQIILLICSKRQKASHPSQAPYFSWALGVFPAPSFSFLLFLFSLSFTTSLWIFTPHIPSQGTFQGFPSTVQHIIPTSHALLLFILRTFLFRTYSRILHIAPCFLFSFLVCLPLAQAAVPAWDRRPELAKNAYIYWFIYLFISFIFLAVSGLSCGTWVLHRGAWASL